ncbi:glycosyltransferase family 87 protein [Cryobacterium frigoriphilum]|uniref:glycosyltransferase family 87 protein n=1 Tax=Cryobacterium frigoriphilum TaxID=1259150 RepID=UPI00141B14D2|nr:glycosyltransferase family 87 protein [Cryobacterium frigoriphilum]
MRTVLISLVLAASAALTGFLVVAFDIFKPGPDRIPLLIGTTALWALFALAVFLLRRVQGRAIVVLILAGSTLIGGAAMAGPPNTSTDSARYAWDGIVQNAGISPYAYTPADDRLDELRPDWLFPAPVTDADGEPSCVGERLETVKKTDSREVFCSTLNRTTVPTIYPPAAEIFFAGVRAITGPAPGYWVLQLAGLLLSLGTTVMLLFGMRRHGINPRWAALWAWCPLVATEAITNSHVDMLGVVFVLAAVFLAASGKHWLGGIALGVAIAAKLIPVLAAPAMLRDRGWKIIVASVATFALLYVPYVLATGIGVLGYLPGYLSEEGYEDGTRFALISLVAPGGAGVIVAGILLLVIAVLVIVKTDPAHPWLGQLVMIGSALLIVSPRYPWYALLLLPFIALTGRWEWLAVPLALTLRLLIPDDLVTQLATGAAVLVIVGVTLWRRRAARAARTAGADSASSRSAERSRP